MSWFLIFIFIWIGARYLGNLERESERRHQEKLDAIAEQKDETLDYLRGKFEHEDDPYGVM